eukprot:5354317-Prymnesium_polylepis.1
MSASESGSTKSKSTRSTNDASASSIASTIVKPAHCTSRRVLSTWTFGRAAAKACSRSCVDALALRSTWMRKRWLGW